MTQIKTVTILSLYTYVTNATSMENVAVINFMTSMYLRTAQIAFLQRIKVVRSNQLIKLNASAEYPLFCSVLRLIFV